MYSADRGRIVNLCELSPEVLVSDESITTLSRESLAALKVRATTNPRRRIRICAHHSLDDAVHEMLIVLARDCYVRPHKHVAKSESFHLAEGKVDVILFDESGQITQIVQLGEYGSGSPFYHRSDGSSFHTVFVRSAVAVVHETTRGPFRLEDNIFAPWSPDENDPAGVARFLELLRSSRRNPAIRGSEGPQT